VLAWKYVDVIDDEDALKLKKKAKHLELTAIPGLGGVVGLVGGVAGTADGVMASVPLIGGGASKVISGIAGGIAPGWAIASGRIAAGLALGENLQEKARHEAVVRAHPPSVTT
jgi:hypothetical protein